MPPRTTLATDEGSDLSEQPALHGLLGEDRPVPIRVHGSESSVLVACDGSDAESVVATWDPTAIGGSWSTATAGTDRQLSHELHGGSYGSPK